MKKDWKFTTKAVHIGSEIDETTGAVIPPIYQTSTFAQKSPGEHQGYEYTRSHNPTRTRLENCLASLENATLLENMLPLVTTYMLLAYNQCKLATQLIMG